MYEHKHTCWMLDMAIRCEEQDKEVEFTHGLRKFFGEVQTVCHKAVIEPRKEGRGKRYTRPADIPYNFTMLDENVKVQGAHRAFEMKRPWGKNSNEAEDDELEHPVVKFSLCFSTDEDPDEIMSAVGVEWSKTGGTMMFKKQLATFREVTPVVIFRLLNSCTRETIIAEFTAILKDALERMNMEDMEEDGEFRDAVI